MGMCRAVRFGTFYWQIVQAVEHHVWVSMEVTGSSPVLPTIIFKIWLEKLQ